MTATRTTFAAALRAAADALATAGVDSPRLDAEVLLAAAAGCDRTRLIVAAAEPVPTEVAVRFAGMLSRRVGREPLQYIVGSREFWSLDFEVTPAVLIPRPETEELIEHALRWARARDRRLRVCDVGTGSGCIAVVLARELGDADIWAVDASPAALTVAARNCARHGVASRVALVCGDLLAAVADRRFDLIVSNPPYAAADSLPGLQPELGWEPRSALDGGVGGLEVIRRLVAAAPASLVAGGALALEIGYDQEESVRALFAAPPWCGATVHRDLQGLPRVIIGEKAG